MSEAGIKKKSFELYFNGGSIWCEHLDGMSDEKEKVIEKFLNDKKFFCRPSMTSFIIIDFDETIFDDEILSVIFDTLANSQKRFMKIAFVGVSRFADRNKLKDISLIKHCPVDFFDDYEKAKVWLLP